jgi:hypothetical protein
VDLIAGPEPANLGRLADAISSLGGVPHGEPQTEVTAELLARDANMRFDTDAGQLAGSGRDRDLLDMGDLLALDE